MKPFVFHNLPYVLVKEEKQNSLVTVFMMRLVPLLILNLKENNLFSLISPSFTEWFVTPQTQQGLVHENTTI